MQLFVELLIEELPASFVRPALASLSSGVVGLLEGIEHGAVRTYATPRRLAVAIDDVTEARPRVEKVVTGPPADRAYKDGEPTKAALGFARGKGVDASALHIVDGPKGKVVAVTVSEGGETARELIAAGLEEVVLGIPFKKSMEWGSGGIRFARPLHRINVLLGGHVVEGSALGIPFGAETEGHRLARGPISFTDATTWFSSLRAHAVEPDLDARKARIHALLAEATERLGCDPIEDEDLTEEVLHLVEAPTLVLGAIDAELLGLPSRLLIKVMKAHQRYFPTFRDGELTERFVVISNNPFADEAHVARGNANVLRARFHDARFFFAEDRKKPLEQHGEQLTKMRWIRGLGSMADKVARLQLLGAQLAPLFGADPMLVSRAAALCKADLATLMVGEFGDLQGHMGRLYASAEDPQVAAAIEEHYQPVSASAPVAPSPVGAALAVAERLDSLAGCFAIGMIPKGSGDPQGLRRAVLGVLHTLSSHGIRTELEPLFRMALEVFDTHAAANGERYGKYVDVDHDAVVARLVEFASARFRANAVRSGVSGDLVDAVLAVGTTDTIDRQARLDALVEAAGTQGFDAIMDTVKRVLNITQDADAAVPSKLGHPAEQALFDAWTHARGEIDVAVDALDYPFAFEAALSLNGPVATFFEDVMVNDDDPVVRSRRLGLLLGISRSFRRLADFSRISTR